MHPADILFDAEKPFNVLPAIDHYAGSQKQMEGALILQGEMNGVFDLTCDCEDGARVGGEQEHAEMVAHLINSDQNLFQRVAVRIHGIDHPLWRQDLEILIEKAGARIAFVTLPKAGSVQDVQTQIKALQQCCKAAGLKKEIPVHVLIETHGALRSVWEIAALPAVESLDFGLMDFVSAHQGAIPEGAMTSPLQFTHPLIVRAKAEIAAAALAHGRTPTHNVSTELKAMERVVSDARIAREQFGFLRMWSIHPHQIEAILEGMRPDFSAIDRATAILLAAKEADWGPIRHEGKLHDRASYRYYWSLLQRAAITGMVLPDAVKSLFLIEKQ